MSLAVTTLGTGTAFPEAQRGPTSNLVEVDGLKIVVDLGSGSLQKLARLGITPLDMDGLFLTHAHLDHIADVLPLLFALGVPGYDRRTPLPIYASAATFEIINRLEKALGSWLTNAREHVRFVTLEPDQRLPIRSAQVSTASMRHHESSLGFRFETPRHTLVIPGDTGPCASLNQLCKDADLAIVECSMRDDDALPGHMTPSQIAELVHRTQIQHIAIVHRYPSVMSVDLVEELTRQTSARVCIPDDGQRFVLEPSPSDHEQAEEA